MKNLIRSLAVFLFALLTSHAHAYGQGAKLELTDGTLNIQFEPTYVAYLEANGISVSHKKNGSGDCHLILGTLDSKTGAGEVHCNGKWTLTSGSTVVDFMSLTLDTSTPAFPTISALVVVNGIYEGRKQIFTVVSGEPYKLPMKAGDNTTTVGFFKGVHYLDYFQVARPDPAMLVGSFKVDATLAKP